jgi:hypothetical protein
MENPPLISIDNPTTQGMPIMEQNGAASYDPQLNLIVYPAQGLQTMPSLLVGISRSPRDVVFYFGTGALPAQANYEQCGMGISEFRLSDATVFFNDMPDAREMIAGWTDDMKQQMQARLRNARQAVNLFLVVLRSTLGHDTSPLSKSQILTFSPYRDHPTWFSRILNVSGFSNERFRRLLIPFCMGQEVDMNPVDMPGSDNDIAEHPYFYSGFIFRFLNLASPHVLSFPGHHANFSLALQDLFLHDRGHTKWIVQLTTTEQRTTYIQRQHNLRTQINLMEQYFSLFWTQFRLEQYLQVHGREWRDVWPRDAPNMGPAFFITPIDWVNFFARTPRVAQIMAHVRANRPITPGWVADMRHLYNSIVSRRLNVPNLPSRLRREHEASGIPTSLADAALYARIFRPKANRYTGGASSSSTEFHFGPPSDLVANLKRFPFETNARAALLSYKAWRNRGPFESLKEYETWINANAGFQDLNNQIKCTVADVANWPLWVFILRSPIQPRANKWPWHELEILTKRAVEHLSLQPIRAAMLLATNQCLMRFRREWLLAENGQRLFNANAACAALDDFLKKFQQ